LFAIKLGIHVFIDIRPADPPPTAEPIRG